jgi:hypothetical protein
LTVPAGVVHAVRNVGSRNAPELATYAVEKGQAAPHGGRVSKWTAGSMPCDGAWSEEQVARFEEWVAAGKPA